MEEEKQPGKREEFQCQPKKRYKTPQLTVYGTLEAITKSPKETGITDGAGRKSN